VQQQWSARHKPAICSQFNIENLSNAITFTISWKIPVHLEYGGSMSQKSRDRVMFTAVSHLPFTIVFKPLVTERTSCWAFGERNAVLSDVKFSLFNSPGSIVCFHWKSRGVVEQFWTLNAGRTEGYWPTVCCEEWMQFVVGDVLN